MSEEERKFFDYWMNNMKGKVSVPTDKLLFAWNLLYNRPITTKCSTCLSNYGQQLKDVFHRLMKVEEELQKKIYEETINIQSNEDFIKEVIKKEELKKNTTTNAKAQIVKNKGTRTVR